MPAELHITSAVVRVRPEAASAVRDQIARLPGLEVHAVAPAGKIVITLETANEREAIDRLDTIRAMSGTIDAAMVYHGVEMLDPNSEETPS